jgi:hypothetical protein
MNIKESTENLCKKIFIMLFFGGATKNYQTTYLHKKKYYYADDKGLTVVLFSRALMVRSSNAIVVY